MYRVEFPIGDWSDDGHCQCEYYTVISNKPVEDLREAHYKCADVLGFGIGEISREYQEDFVRNDILEILDDHHIEYPENVDKIANPKDILIIWLNILMFIDPNLKLTIEEKEKMQSINFYGYDEKSRHVDTPGYGCFE